MLSRVRTHLRWRFDNALRRRGLQLAPAVPNERLRRLAPRDFELRGVRLDLTEGWATPTLCGTIYDRCYEDREARIVEATIRPSDRVLEIGCGVGFLATVASRIVGDAVRCYDADPAMVTAARRTIERNGASATITAAVLQPSPVAETISFYVHDDFWASSLVPDPEATEISVPVLDLAREITEQAASYLLIDIEGGETDLLLDPLPACVRKLCVECHPTVSSPAAITAMLVSVLSQDFALSLEHSRPPVLYFER
jgi:FkbM family methyltransferase